jgi:hypothetical protein
MNELSTCSIVPNDYYSSHITEIIV